MRESCIQCVQKHLGQAVVLFIESRMGYASHRVLAIGHLAEAEAESIKDFPDLAIGIREERKRIEEDITYDPDIMALITEAMEIEAEIRNDNDEKETENEPDREN